MANRENTCNIISKMIKTIRSSFYILCLLTVTLVACDDDIFGNSQSQMVVDGWIEDGGFPIVIITQTLPITEDLVSVNNLGDYIVKWAKVTVSDGVDSVVLTGKYDNNYFPPYIYTTGRMRGKAGHTYYLTIKENDNIVRSVTTIPVNAPDVDFKVEMRSSNDSLYQITACLSDSNEQADYYQIFSRVGVNTSQYSAAFLGSLSDATLGDYAEIPVYRGKVLSDSVRYTPYYHISDSVSVKIASVDEDSFHFWSDFTNNISLSSNLFLSPSNNIYSNVKGAIGCWYGMNPIEKHFVIADHK